MPLPLIQFELEESFFLVFSGYSLAFIGRGDLDSIDDSLSSIHECDLDSFDNSPSSFHECDLDFVLDILWSFFKGYLYFIGCNLFVY